MYTNDLKFEKTYIETESKMILNSIVVYIRNSGRLNLLMAKMYTHGPPVSYGERDHG